MQEVSSEGGFNPPRRKRAWKVLFPLVLAHFYPYFGHLCGILWQRGFQGLGRWSHSGHSEDGSVASALGGAWQLTALKLPSRWRNCAQFRKSIWKRPFWPSKRPPGGDAVAQNAPHPPTPGGCPLGCFRGARHPQHPHLGRFWGHLGPFSPKSGPFRPVGSGGADWQVGRSVVESCEYSQEILNYNIKGK